MDWIAKWSQEGFFTLTASLILIRGFAWGHKGGCSGTDLPQKVPRRPRGQWLQFSVVWSRFTKPRGLNTQDQDGLLLIRRTEGTKAYQCRDWEAVAQRQTWCPTGAQIASPRWVQKPIVQCHLCQADKTFWINSVDSVARIYESLREKSGICLELPSIWLTVLRCFVVFRRDEILTSKWLMSQPLLIMRFFLLNCSGAKFRLYSVLFWLWHKINELSF